jgi:hypothetical protein
MPLIQANAYDSNPGDRMWEWTAVQPEDEFFEKARAMLEYQL